MTGPLDPAVPASTRENDVPQNATAAHASQAAYANAVISLKDPKSGMRFYVESNGRRLVAFDEDAAVVWSTDVLAEVKIKLTPGTSLIRHLRVEGHVLWVTCGKSDTLRIHMKTGKTEYVGAD